MIFVKGIKWEFNKRKDGTVYVSPLPPHTKKYKPFIYRPTTVFSCKKLKKNIRKRLKKNSLKKHNFVDKQ